MTQRAEEFFAAIKPFADLWRTVRVSLLAARREGVWLLVAARFMLSPSGSRVQRLCIQFDDFLAIDADMEIQLLSEVIASIEEKSCLPSLRLPSGKVIPACYISSRHAGIPNSQEFSLSCYP